MLLPVSLLELFDSSADLQGVGGVNAKEDPEDFSLLCPGPDSAEAIAIFLVAKTPFESGGPLPPNLFCQDFSMNFELPSPALSLEVSFDLLTGTPTAVGVGRIDGISSDEPYLVKKLARLGHSRL